jgi:hypothetical protein
MINSEDNMPLVLYSRTYSSDSDNDATVLTVPKEFAKELDIENCKISITVLHDFKGRKYLLVSKYHKEIIIR